MLFSSEVDSHKHPVNDAALREDVFVCQRVAQSLAHEFKSFLISGDVNLFIKACQKI